MFATMTGDELAVTLGFGDSVGVPVPLGCSVGVVVGGSGVCVPGRGGFAVRDALGLPAGELDGDDVWECSSCGP
jgi:hypothetical protein